MSTMEKENKRYENTKYSEEYSILKGHFVPLKKSMEFPTVLTLRASLGVTDPREFPHPLRCVTLAVLIVPGDAVPLRVPRLASTANQTRAISGLKDMRGTGG
jgi:hypothetical protein